MQNAKWGSSCFENNVPLNYFSSSVSFNHISSELLASFGGQSENIRVIVSYGFILNYSNSFIGSYSLIYTYPFKEIMQAAVPDTNFN